VKSRSNKQLRYKLAAHLTKDCESEGNIADGTPIVPCGLIAWSLFNDTYTVSVNKKAVEVSKKDIAWQSDKKINSAVMFILVIFRREILLVELN
jgi:hypothetical protein